MSSNLPAGWVWARFSDVARIAANLVDPANWPALPHVAPDNIDRDTGRLLPYRSVEEDGVTSAKHRFYPGQLLYSKIRPYLNKCVKAEFDGLCSADMYPVDALISAGFLHHFMLTRQFVSAVSEAAGSRTILPKTNQAQMAALPVPVAPLREQLQITEALDSLLSRLDAAAATLGSAERKLKAYRASVLKAAAEGRLVPTEAQLARTEGRDYEPADGLLACILKERRRRWEEVELAKGEAAGKTPKNDRWKAKYSEPKAPDTDTLADLPDGWCWATVDQLGEVTGGITKNAARDHGLARYPYLRVANVYANRLVLDDVKDIVVGDHELERLLLRRGDLLVVEGNGSVDQIGRVALWDGSIDRVVHQNHLIRVRFARRPLERWVLTWLLSPGGRAAIQRVASSTSGLHTLSISKVQSLPVPLPPESEQVRVLETVDQLLSINDASANGVDASLRRCSRLRQSVLRWAFEGTLVDQDSNDEPADVLLERIRAGRPATAPRRPKVTRARKLKAVS